MWRWLLTVIVAAMLAFVAGVSVQAATGWTPFATASDNSDYSAYASADADITHVKALAIRASAAAKLSWFVSCSSIDKTMPANTPYEVSIANSKKCSLYGSANTSKGGTVKLQLLKR